MYLAFKYFPSKVNPKIQICVLHGSRFMKFCWIGKALQSLNAERLIYMGLGGGGELREEIRSHKII